MARSPAPLVQEHWPSAYLGDAEPGAVAQRRSGDRSQQVGAPGTGRGFKSQLPTLSLRDPRQVTFHASPVPSPVKWGGHTLFRGGKEHLRCALHVLGAHCVKGFVTDLHARHRAQRWPLRWSQPRGSVSAPGGPGLGPDYNESPFSSAGRTQTQDVKHVNEERKPGRVASQLRGQSQAQEQAEAASFSGRVGVTRRHMLCWTALPGSP